MKKLSLTIGALICFARLAFAQVEVSISFDQEQFLPNEPIIAKVRILNNSGQTLTLGKDPDWLTFYVEGTRKKIVEQLKDVKVEGEFTLPSAHRATKKVDLNGCFDFSQLSRYLVVATVRVPQWGASYTSKTAHFDLSPGTTLKEITFGIPAEKQGVPPEIRKYMLVQANHLKDIRLYARITDGEGEHTYKIFPVGSMISFSRPEAQLDNWSNLHLLFQNGARSFTYASISPDGHLLARENWEYTDDNRPELRVLESGAIRVRGGVRRLTSTDLPPPDFSTPQKSAPEETNAIPVQPVKPADKSKSADAKSQKKKK